MRLFQKKKSTQPGVLQSTYRSLSRVVGFLRGKKKLDPEDLVLLQNQLVSADLGWSLTQEAIAYVDGYFSQGLNEDEDCAQALKQFLRSLFPEHSLVMEGNPVVILMVGVNGAGKTTTIGKLAHQYVKQGHQVMLASGDTYRAAAKEQLEIWADRSGAGVVSSSSQDPAAVMYDAYDAAKKEKSSILIADTAGRMQGNKNLMGQLSKVKRVLGKLDDQAPHHTWLVIDGSLGQNSLEQAKIFHEQVGLTGLIVTKLDGMAKGGVLFSIVRELALPVYFVGLGEGKDDLKAFDPDAFIDEIFVKK